MKLPESKLLRGLIGWFAGGVLFHLLIASFRQEHTISDAVGNFITDLMAPYLWGSFCSQIPLVWIGSAICAAIYAISVTTQGGGAPALARLSLLAILFLSLFTIWLEPYTSVAGVGVTVAMELAKVPMKFFDAGVSVLWLVLYVRASAAVGRECRRAVVADRAKRVTSPTRPGLARGVIGGGLILLSMLLFLAFIGYLFIMQ